MATNYIYKTVDMVAGEKLVLPSGGEVIGVTDSSLVTSTCSDELPDVELACFYMQWAINVDPEGDRMVFSPAFPLVTLPIKIPKINNAWDPDDDGPPILVLNFGITGQVAAINVNCQDFTSLEGAIITSSFGALLSSRKWNHEEHIEPLTAAESTNWLGQGNFRSGYYIYQLAFKAIKEIGETAYLELQGPNGNTGSPTRYYAQPLDCAEFPLTTEVVSSATVISPITTSTTTTTTTP